jgi:hypothetical protein
LNALDRAESALATAANGASVMAGHGSHSLWARPNAPTHWDLDIFGSCLRSAYNDLRSASQLWIETFGSRFEPSRGWPQLPVHWELIVDGVRPSLLQVDEDWLDATVVLEIEKLIRAPAPPKSNKDRWWLPDIWNDEAAKLLTVTKDRNRSARPQEEDFVSGGYLETLRMRVITARGYADQVHALALSAERVVAELS